MNPINLSSKTTSMSPDGQGGYRADQMLKCGIPCDLVEKSMCEGSELCRISIGSDGQLLTEGDPDSGCFDNLDGYTSCAQGSEVVCPKGTDEQEKLININVLI